MENEKNVVTYDETIEEKPENTEEINDDNESSEGKIRLQLGDIIELIDEFEKSNNGIFLIDYIDNSFLRLKDENEQTHDYELDDGYIINTSISEIHILSRAESPSWIIQNNFNMYDWVNIYIGGDIPAVIVGKITNIEEDMMEIVNMTNDTFYINFDYKGIPLDIPITKIEINLKLQNVNDNTIDLDKINIPTPTISKEREELNDTGEQFDEETPEFSREKVVVDETYGEVDVDDDNEEYGYPDKEEQPKKMTRDVLDRWIKEGDKILMSKDIDLQDIDEIQKVDRNKYRYDQETQLNDLMNDLLTSVSVEKQTPDFINQVHTLVERYKQLINEPVIENKTKPLVDNLQLLNKFLYWLVPICANVKIIYQDDKPPKIFDNECIDSRNQTAELESIIRMFKTFQQRGDVNDLILKYDEFLQTMNSIFTPFEQVTNEFPVFKKVLFDGAVEDNYTCIVNTTGHLYSNAFSLNTPDGIESQRFITQKYNTEIQRFNATSITSSIITGEVIPVTNADNLQITSIMTLPHSVFRYSRVGLRGTNIVTKINMSRLFLDYNTLLNNYQLRTIEINDLTKDIDISKSSFLKYPTVYTTTSNDYPAFLNKIIPETKNLIQNIKKYITGELSTLGIIRELEPFLVYSRDVDLSTYTEIGTFIKDKIKSYVKSDILKKRLLSPLRYIYTSKNSIFKNSRDPSCELLYSLLRSKHNLDYMVFHIYGLIENTETKTKNDFFHSMTTSELINNIMYIDNAKFFYTGNCVLGLPLHIAESMMYKIHQRLQDVIDNTSCETFVISKLYNTQEEMEMDNNKEVYYDRNYDNTDYSLITKYRKEQREMSKEDFEGFFTNKLIQNHKVKEEEANEMALAIIMGAKRVKNGDHAILYGFENIIYLVRDNNIWKLIPPNDTQSFMNETTSQSICNTNPDCIYDTNVKPTEGCISVEENKRLLYNQSLKLMMKEFDETVMKDVREIKDGFYDEFYKQSIAVTKLLIIRKFQQTKYSTYQYNYGLGYKYIGVNITSPYEDVCKLILAETDVVKKYNNIIKFVTLATRPGNPDAIDSISGEPESTHWLYCNRANVRLIPSFYSKLAYSFIEGDSEEYEYVMDKLIQTNGVAIDDAWYDKFTGRKIKDLDYDLEEGYENGFKRKTRDIIEEDLGNMLFNQNTTDESSQAVPKQKMTKKTIPIFRIIQSIENNTGADLSSDYDFIVSLALKIITKIVPSEKQHEDMIAKMSKKGKKVASYDDIYYKTLVYTTLGIILVCIQTSVPSIKIMKKGYPGCNRSFKGFPLDTNSANLSGIQYIACTAVHSRVDSYPWKVISKNQEQVSTAIKLFIEQNLLEDIEIKQRLEYKRNYVSLYEIDTNIPEQFDVVMNLPLFLPPLKPLKMKQIEILSPSLEEGLKRKISSGSHSQEIDIATYKSHIIFLSIYIQYLIQNVVIKNPVLLLTVSNKPYMENSCCDEGSITPIQYFNHLEPQINRTIDAVLSDTIVINRIGYLTVPKTIRIPHIYPIYNVIPSFSDDTMYRYFSQVCNFRSDLPYSDPVIEKWCGEKPDYLVGLDITKQLELIQQKHVTSWYNKRHFIQLIQYISSKNLLPPVQPILKLEEYIAIIQNTDKTELNVPFMKSILDRMNPLLPEYFHFVKKQPQEVVEYINTFVVLNKKLKISILDFLKTQKRRTQDITKVKVFLDTLGDWKCNDIMIILNYFRNSLRNIINVFPNIILNGKSEYTYFDSKRNKFSDNHYRDIYTFMTKYYKLITMFCDKAALKPLLQRFTSKLKNIQFFLDTYISTRDRVDFSKDKEERLSSPFGERSSQLLFENILLETLHYLITLITKKGITKFVPQSEEALQYDYVNADEDEELITPVNGFQEYNSEESNIERGKQTIVKDIVSEYLIQIFTILMRHKGMIDVTKEEVKSRVFKNAEKEKYTITDRLKEMSVEQRGVENIMKINKLGEWSVGLDKSIRVYDQSMYDRERRLFKDMETESDEDLINRLKSSKKGLDIDQQDLLNEVLTEKEISDEAYDMSDMGEDYHNYYMGEEDDRDEFDDEDS